MSTRASGRRWPNFFDPRLLPPAPLANGRRWAMRLLMMIAAGTVFGLTLRYDLPLMQWRYQLFPEGPKGLLKQVFYGFRDFGQIMPIFVGMVIILRVDKRRWTILMLILMAQILAGIGSNTGKLTILRYRPHVAVERVGDLAQMQFNQTWLGWAAGNQDEAMQSFPSGHSAGAFAFAGVLAWFYPRLAGLLWFLAAGCAFSRYIDGVHWLSDCVAGAMIGYIGAWLALRPYAWAVPYWIIRKAMGRPPRRAEAY